MNYSMMLLYARLKPHVPPPWSLALVRGTGKDLDGDYDPVSRTFVVAVPPHADRDALDTLTPLLLRWIDHIRRHDPR